MPTLVALESFQHLCLPLTNAGSNYQAINNGGTLPNHGGGQITFDTTQPRTGRHRCSLKIVFDTTATNLRFLTPSGVTTVLVGSFYFRSTANPSALTDIFRIVDANGDFFIRVTTGGLLQALIQAGTGQTSATTVTDGVWHLIDFYANSAGGTATLDVSLDGVALTQATHVQASANLTTPFIGQAGITTFTAWYSDIVLSATSGDHPIGHHICLPLTIDGEGSDNLNAHISDQGGGTTNLYQAVDDPWDGTTPAFTNAPSDYVKQTTGGAGNGDYAEFTLTDPPYDTIWDVQLISMMAANASTQADTCRAAIFYSGAATADTGVIDPSISSTNLAYYRTFAARPSGGWDGTKLAAAVVRWGYSTDATPNPIANAFLVEYAAPWSPSLIYGGPSVKPLMVMS